MKPPEVFAEGVQFNSAQAQAVFATEQNVLVLAGPGSGKTHTLVGHAAVLCSRYPGRVVLLTFARRAADEMASRSKSILRPGVARGSIVARTIHAHALELLRVHGWRVGFSGPSVSLVGKAEVQAKAAEVAAERGIPESDLIGWAEKLERIRRTQTPIDSLPAQDAALIRAVEGALIEEGTIDYAGALALGRRLLDEHPAVRASVWRHDQSLIVDEAQDLSPLQLNFLTGLVGPSTHVAVAMDANQSLYRWRAADPDRVLAWARSFDPLEVSLTQNFRSAARIASFGNAVLGTPATTPSRAARGEVYLLQFPTVEHEAAAIVQWLTSRLGDRRFADIAILSRASHRLRAVRDACVAKGVPIREPSVSLSSDEQDLLNVISAIAEWSSGQEPNSGGVRSLPWRELGVLPELAAELESKALVSGLHPGDLLSVGIWPIVRELAESRRSPRQLLEEVASLMEIGQSEYGRLARLAGDARTLGAFVRAASRAGRGIAETTDAVMLSTFHGSKGLEFEVVFIVGVEQGVVPDYRAKKPERLLEERRALFVAATRARDILALSFVHERDGQAQSISSFLPPAESQIWSVNSERERDDSQQ